LADLAQRWVVVQLSLVESRGVALSRGSRKVLERKLVHRLAKVLYQKVQHLGHTLDSKRLVFVGDLIAVLGDGALDGGHTVDALAVR
jgi:hypothetical protein